jgi:hypothetical protein
MGDFVIFLFDSAICVETVVNGSDFFRVKKHEKFAIITLQTMRFAIIGLLTWTLL